MSKEQVKIHSVAVNKDTKNNTLSCIMLVSSGEKATTDKRKNVKIWHRFFCGSDIKNICDQIDTFTKWKATYTNGKKVTSNNFKKRVKDAEILEDKFVSTFYLLPDYEVISKTDSQAISNILGEYNERYTLFSTDEIADIRMEISERLQEEFNYFAGTIEKFIWHKVISIDEKLNNKEVI